MCRVFWLLTVCLLLPACTTVPSPVERSSQTPRPASGTPFPTSDFFDKSPQITIEPTPTATVESTLHIDRTNARYEWLTISAGSLHELVDSVAVAADGTVWIGASGRAGRYLRGGNPEWQFLPIVSTHDELLYEKVVDVCRPDATPSHTGALESPQSGATFCEYTVKLAQPKPAGVRVIATAPDGSLWFGTYQGVVHYIPDGNPEWTTFTRADGLPRNQIDEIVVGSDGSVWVIIDSGVGYKKNVSRYTPGEQTTWTPFPVHCLDDCSVTTIAFGTAGSMWFGTDEGLIHYTRGVYPEWETLIPPDSDPWYRSVSAIAVDPAGSVWFGGYGSVSHYTPGGHPEWQTFAIGAEKTGTWPGKYVRTITVGQDHTVWVGTLDDVRYYAPDRDSQQKSFTIVKGLEGQIVNDSAVGPDGSVWIAGSDGVAHMK